MQSWYSIGSMAPSLCKMFVSFKSKKLIHVKKKKKKRTCRERGSVCVLEAWNGGVAPSMDQDDAGADSPPGVCIQLPRLSKGSPPHSSVNHAMGRHSDVTAGFPRFSTSSSCYERLSEEYHQGEGQDLSRLAKLGVASNISGVLARQDSAMSLAQQRDSSCSVASFVSSTSSKLRGAYAQQTDLLRKQPHIGELFAGNQFLTHLTAAPSVFTSPCEHALLQPSAGLLDASLRCRDADLKDRIILFL